jgi:hypothetical protein
MIRSACLGVAISAAAFACSGAPAGAATYVGHLSGIVDAGEASYYTYEDPSNPIEVDDLTGKDMAIDFTADVMTNYTDPANGRFYPKFIVESVNLYLTNGYLDTSGTIEGSSDNQYDNGNLNVDGQGKISGNFMYSGSFDPLGDYTGAETFSFTGASKLPGPLTGSGSYDVTDFAPQGEIVSDLSFSLTNGNVYATSTPEPAAWAMLACGFGVVGAAMRSRSRTSGGRPRPGDRCGRLPAR